MQLLNRNIISHFGSYLQLGQVLDSVVLIILRSYALDAAYHPLRSS